DDSVRLDEDHLIDTDLEQPEHNLEMMDASDWEAGLSVETEAADEAPLASSELTEETANEFSEPTSELEAPKVENEAESADWNDDLIAEQIDADAIKEVP